MIGEKILELKFTATVKRDFTATVESARKLWNSEFSQTRIIRILPIKHALSLQPA